MTEEMIYFFVVAPKWKAIPKKGGCELVTMRWGTSTRDLLKLQNNEKNFSYENSVYAENNFQYV